jgi:hypothetical protein
MKSSTHCQDSTGKNSEAMKNTRRILWSENPVEFEPKRIARALTMQVNVLEIGEALSNKTEKVRG